MATLLYNPVQVIRAFALMNTALVAHIQNRMYYPSIPEKDHSFPAISYQILSGPFNQYIPYSRLLVEFRCYDSRERTPKQASSTFKYLFDAIHDKQNVQAPDLETVEDFPIVYWSKCVSGPQPLTDPFTQWHFNRSLFEIAITHDTISP